MAPNNIYFLKFKRKEIVHSEVHSINHALTQDVFSLLRPSSNVALSAHEKSDV